MEKMKIWYDEEEDYLEIGFGKKKGYVRKEESKNADPIYNR